MSTTFRIRRTRTLAVAFAAIALAFYARDGQAQGISSGGVKVTTGPGSTAGKPVPTGGTVSAGGGTITLGDDSGKKGSKIIPPTHTVRKGDTLWDICDTYYQNPWQWPRVWSYNPEIINPHWIYPGEIVRLKKEGGIKYSDAIKPSKTSVVLKPQLVPTGTIFLRDQGFLYDNDVKDSGEITGSPEDKMLLSSLDRVYIKLSSEQLKNTYVGDTLTIFQQTRSVKDANGNSVGSVIQILGTVKIEMIDKDNSLAEGMITESLDVIERGARVGPIERRIDQVPPSTNQVDLRGALLTSVQPNQMFGANQIVLLDKGDEDGLRPGNRLFVVRRGDPWKQGLSSAGALSASKITLSTDGPAEVGKSQQTDSTGYPEEVIAEVRVIRTRKKTATGLVTNAHFELLPGDIWVSKKGY